MTLQELITDLKAAGANENTMQLAMNCYELGLKNAMQAQPEQEPVAYMYERARYGPTDLRGQQWLLELSRLKPYTGNGLVRGVRPLYTHPIAQTWAGLPESAFAGMTLQQVTAMKYAEQILKDQNI